MRYLDNFFRRSPHADVILQYRNSILLQKANEVNEEDKNIESVNLLANDLTKQKGSVPKSEGDLPEEYDV